MQELARQAKRERRRIGLVPTMGFLHEGHLSLLRKCREACDLLVVSIFVNPTQFGPGEDLDKYPRDIERDCGLCRSESVDVVFAPSAREMYSNRPGVYVDEPSLSRILCGEHRPGHFRGVLTVVAKLFNIVQPDVAAFGQKDAQQARIIEQMVRDLNFPVEIVVCPTVREPDGLAMSSRNSYLSAEERERALCLYKSLCQARELYDAGRRDAGSIRKAMAELIAASGGDVDYIEIVDYNTLEPVEEIKKKTLIALAVRIGTTRLIDNIIFS